MTAHDLEYVELYATDGKSIVDYFVSAFGFAEVAHSNSSNHDEGRESTLLRQANAHLVVTTGPATYEFLEQHGDGVADIAFACADVPGAWDRAMKAGASSFRAPSDGDGSAATVSGFGDVRHTLVHRPPGAAPRAPVDRAWTEVSDDAGSRADPSRIGQVDHIAVCVGSGDLQATVRYYIAAFGLERYYSEYIQVGNQAMDSVVVRSPSGQVTFTILEPDSSRDRGQLNDFLDRNGGAGVQHVAFLVGEIISSVSEFRDRGVEFLWTPGAYYDVLADRVTGLLEEIADLRETNVLADCDEWGYLLQLFTKSPHERSTLFYELIQRHGAQGFGSANIRALYEAVERERINVH